MGIISIAVVGHTMSREFRPIPGHSDPSRYQFGDFPYSSSCVVYRLTTETWCALLTFRWRDAAAGFADRRAHPEGVFFFLRRWSSSLPLPVFPPDLPVPGHAAVPVLGRERGALPGRGEAGLRFPTRPTGGGGEERQGAPLEGAARNTPHPGYRNPPSVSVSLLTSPLSYVMCAVTITLFSPQRSSECIYLFDNSLQTASPLQNIIHSSF